MTTVVKVAGWEAFGLRCPDHRISLENSDGDVHSVSLIQMPNGTGKTTTLQLLRAALSGEGPNGGWSPTSVREMRKNDHTLMGEFRVSLLTNGKRLTISMTFDFEEGLVKYATTLPSGKRNDFRPPRDLEKFLNPSFVNFFVFDGELADSLLDRSKTNAERVVDDLFQLSLFHHLHTWVDSYWKDQTAAKARSANTNSTTEKGLNKWSGWIERLEERLKYLEDEQNAAIEEEKRLKTLLLKRRNESDAAIKAKAEFGKKMAEAEDAVRSAEAVVQASSHAVLQTFRNPHAISSVFAAEMLALKHSLDRVKLPETSAREFFEELAREEVCVCGNPIDETARANIRERAHLYLGSDDVALLNNLKSEVATQIGDNPDAHAKRMDRQIADLQEAIKVEQAARTARDAIKSKAVHDDPALEEKEREMEELQQQLVRLQIKLERFEDTDDKPEIEDNWGIAVVRARLEKARNTYAQIADTLVLKKRCDVLQHIIQDARLESRINISAAICDQANQRIQRLMPHNSILIERLDQCLRLKGKGGGSAGETLAVAYGFLATLFDRTEHQLPFVVDSPAGPLDHPKRAAVAKLIPRLANQFVAFTISTEREAFQDKLEAEKAAQVHYLTLFRKGTVQVDKHRQQLKVTETEDGMLVEGREFFETFQIEEE